MYFGYFDIKWGLDPMVVTLCYRYGIPRLEHTGIGSKEMTGYAENNDTWAYSKDNLSRFVTDNHVRYISPVTLIAYINIIPDCNGLILHIICIYIFCVTTKFYC